MFLARANDAQALIRAACAVESVPYGRCGFPCDGSKRIAELLSAR
jgi:hypothetical protein